jgi:hypothetical protein
MRSVEDDRETISIPSAAVAVKLYRVTRNDDLIGCEPVAFANGAIGIDTVMRRAAISGRVEVEGKIGDHFADLLDARGSMVATVALDAGSYRMLKTRWMRTRVEVCHVG